MRKLLLTGRGMEMVSASFQFRMMPRDLHMLLTGILVCIVSDSVNVLSLKAYLGIQKPKELGNMLWFLVIIYCLVVLCSDLCDFWMARNGSATSDSSATDGEYLKILDRCSWFMQRMTMCSQAIATRMHGIR